MDHKSVSERDVLIIPMKSGQRFRSKSGHFFEIGSSYIYEICIFVIVSKKPEDRDFNIRSQENAG